MEGKKVVGRPRMHPLDWMKHETENRRCKDLKKSALDRCRWRTWNLQHLKCVKGKNPQVEVTHEIINILNTQVDVIHEMINILVDLILATSTLLCHSINN